jgi:hypothetical protein
LLLETGALSRRLTVSSLAEPLPCAHGKPLLPVVANNGNINSFNLKGKTAMKTSILVAAIVACALSAPIVSAQEKAVPAKPAMSMDMDKQMPQMQENMKKMQEQMGKVQATTDPKERQKLMQEHMLAMQENMKTMRGMGGPMMMGSGQGGGMMMGSKKGGMVAGDVMKRPEMMEKRMDMMQMMMEQMMQHDQMMEPMPAK